MPGTDPTRTEICNSFNCPRKARFTTRNVFFLISDPEGCFAKTYTRTFNKILSISEWQPWTEGSCSHSCGGGTRVDDRECWDYTNAVTDDTDCAPGTEGTRVENCNEDPCPSKEYISKIPVCPEFEDFFQWYQLQITK